MLDVLWVEEGEAGELGLIKVHHEQLVCGSQFSPLRRELLVEVAYVLTVTLKYE